MEIEIEMEDLAMGIKPKAKPSAKLKKDTKDTIAVIDKIIAGVESEAIADYKKYPEADKRALIKAYDKLSDTCYTAKNLIREACEKPKYENAIGISDEY